MTDFNHGVFMDELRKRRGKIPADLYADMMAAITAGLAKPSGTAAAPRSGKDPAWLVEARANLGTKETVGPQHSSKILGWVKKLGGWFTDDETPWCGTFAGYCMTIAGVEIPKNWFRARDWESWGKPCQPAVGAVVVFAREGGGHVGFLVGESSASYYVLGGNQSNMVSITPIAKTRATAVRWPSGLPLPYSGLPVMSGGTVSRNEA